MWILDTDHFSLLQRGNLTIVKRLSKINASQIAITIITAKEQMRGRLDVIRRSKTSNELVLSYQRLRELLEDLNTINVLNFTAEASALFDELKHQKIRTGSQDLKIAAIALAVKGIVVTRNRRDFEKVPGLVWEDWTIEEGISDS